METEKQIVILQTDCPCDIRIQRKGHCSYNTTERTTQHSQEYILDDTDLEPEESEGLPLCILQDCKVSQRIVRMLSESPSARGPIRYRTYDPSLVTELLARADSLSTFLLHQNQKKNCQRK